MDPAFKVPTEPGVGTGPKKSADHGSGGRTDLEPFNIVSMKTRVFPPR